MKFCHSVSNVCPHKNITQIPIGCLYERGQCCTVPESDRKKDKYKVVSLFRRFTLGSFRDCLRTVMIDIASLLQVLLLLSSY